MGRGEAVSPHHRSNKVDLDFGSIDSLDKQPYLPAPSREDFQVGGHTEGGDQIAPPPQSWLVGQNANAPLHGPISLAEASGSAISSTSSTRSPTSPEGST